MWAGVDVGARILHAVVLDGRGRLLGTAAFDGAEPLVRWLDGAAGVGVDSPDAWSTAPHASDATLSPKFRTARCGEIGLGRLYRIWVPWTTPVDPAPGSWMAAGIELCAALRAAGHQPLEVYPYGGFRLLGGRLPPKTTAAGRSARAEVLGAAGVDAGPLGRSHDLLDAAMAALVALHHGAGLALGATCGHDGSAIWLPFPARSQAATMGL